MFLNQCCFHRKMINARIGWGSSKIQCANQTHACIKQDMQAAVLASFTILPCATCVPCGLQTLLRDSYRSAAVTLCTKILERRMNKLLTLFLA
jgi:hypothetical protein